MYSFFINKSTIKSCREGIKWLLSFEDNYIEWPEADHNIQLFSWDLEWDESQ